MSSTIRILSPKGRVNYSSLPIVEWKHVPTFLEAKIELHDNDGVLLQDTNWQRVVPGGDGVCRFPAGIGHKIKKRKKGRRGPKGGSRSASIATLRRPSSEIPPEQTILKGLEITGVYRYKLSLRDIRGQELTANGSFSIAPNADIDFGAGKRGKWSAPEGAWQANASTYGVVGRTQGLKDFAFLDSPVYLDSTRNVGNSPANLDLNRAYSYTVSMKLNGQTCRAGLAVSISDPPITGPKQYSHVNFLISANRQLTVEAQSSKLPPTLATIDLRRHLPRLDVHQFFSLRVEFRPNVVTAVVFVNKSQVLSRTLVRYVKDGISWPGKAGLAYHGTNAGDGFEVRSFLVRPSIWEGLGFFHEFDLE